MEAIITFKGETDPVWIIYKKDSIYGIAVELLGYTFIIEVYGTVEECTNYIKTHIN